MDHDRAQRSAARHVLETEGYRVLDAGDVAAAEQIATLYVGPIHVLLVDLDVPSVRRLCDRLRSLHPELRVVCASERPQHRPGPWGPFVRKPFERRRLTDAIRGVLGEPR